MRCGGFRIEAGKCKPEKALFQDSPALEGEQSSFKLT